jgi:hypothetical protein
MKHLGIYLLAPLLLTACLATSPESPMPLGTKQDSDVAMRAYQSCTRVQAATLDDGISDANTVASAVYAACSQEARASKEAFIRTKTSNSRYIEEFLNDPGIDSDTRQTALRSVFEVRSLRSNKQK